jgi:hypothetical protein
MALLLAVQKTANDGVRNIFVTKKDAWHYHPWTITAFGFLIFCDN